MSTGADGAASGQVAAVALANQILARVRTMSSAMAGFFSLVSRFDELQGFREWGSRSTADWLAWQAGVRPITAREYVRVARALRRLPLIRAAFVRGELSFSKVRALTRAATLADERSLMARARVSTAAEVEQIVRDRRRAKAIRDPAWGMRHRSVRQWIDTEGMSVTLARLPVAEGEVLGRAIRLAERDVPKDGVTAVTNGEDLDAPGAGERLRADALVEVARRFLAGGSSSEQAREARYGAIVHLDATSGRISVGEQPISVKTAERALCDAVLSRATHRPGGRLDLGRSLRVVSPALRKAVGIRDGERCQFPGCRNRRYLAVHHATHWAHRGKTAIYNVLLLCTWHHQLVHEGGFTLAMEDGEVIVRAPSGLLVTDRGPPSPRGVKHVGRAS